MDIHTDTHQLRRVEVVHTGRRRRWTTAEKIRIVEESLAEPGQASATARRYGMKSSQLFGWRRAYREGRLGGSRSGSTPAFVRAVVVPDAIDRASPRNGAADGGRMEIVLGNGRRVVVGPDVDVEALARVIAVLEAP